MIVRGVEQMEEEAARFARGLTPFPNHARVVALSGDLGAGKTTFVRGVLRAFGVEESVTSPTFVIAKSYVLPHGPFARAVHIDAYRLHTAEELGPIRWDETLAEPHTLVLLEWPEQVPGALPPHATILELSFVDESTRSFGVSV